MWPCGDHCTAGHSHLSHQEPIPLTDTASLQWNPRSALPPPDSTAPRKRIDVACARCRKRKIRCSGNSDGLGCTACGRAGVSDLCWVRRVGDLETKAKEMQLLRYPTTSALGMSVASLPLPFGRDDRNSFTSRLPSTAAGSTEQYMPSLSGYSHGSSVRMPYPTSWHISHDVKYVRGQEAFDTPSQTGGYPIRLPSIAQPPADMEGHSVGWNGVLGDTRGSGQSYRPLEIQAASTLRDLTMVREVQHNPGALPKRERPVVPRREFLRNPLAPDLAGGIQKRRPVRPLGQLSSGYFPADT